LSSILRALKKLDADSISQENPESSAKISMRQIVDRRNRTPWRIHNILVILLILLLTASSVWFFFNNHRNAPHQKIQKPEPPTLTLKNIPPPPALVPVKSSAATKEAPPFLQPATAPTFTPITPQPQPVPIETPPITTPPHPQLVLNGTLWSEIPERRVALINDRYLKEGDQLNGVTILQIDKKSVLLQQGQEQWTLTVKK